MEFSSDHHHQNRDEEEEDEEEEEGSEEMLMNNNHIINTSSSSLNRAKMVEALSHVQIQPTLTIPPPTSSSSSNKPRYRECLRNHAINVMGHALDGCGEFMPGGPEGSVEALKCAACGCHRNFHRKEEAGEHHTTSLRLYSHRYGQQHTSTAAPFNSYYRASASAPSGYLHLGPPRPLALPSASGGGGVEELDDVSNPTTGAGHNGGMVMMRNGGGGGKKRFRTKFTAEQKERMLGMAERIGWRIQKCDEDLVQQFCNETAVKRHVFKVWMHNNKHTLGKGITTTTSSNLNINNNSSSSNTSRQQQQLMN